MEYIIQDDTIIFEPEFDEDFEEYEGILSGVKKIIFSNYELHKGLFNYYSIAWDKLDKWVYNKINEYYFMPSQFNKFVDKLPPNITHIFFSEKFNQNVANLPCQLTRLIFGMNFNHSVDNLPATLEILTWR